MPVVTSAIAAVTIATAVTTVATVASAVVAVSTLVATVGLAVTAVGMVTGNKDILKAGNIMGMVGLAGGLAGLGVGAAASAFSTAPTIANQFANPALAESISGSIAGAGVKGGVAGSGVLAPTTSQVAQVGAGSVLAPAAGTPGLLSSPQSVGPAGQSLAQAGSSALSGPPPAPGAGVTPPASSQAGITAPLAPINPTVRTPGIGSGGSEKVKNFWDTLPDWQKAQLVTTGAQGVTGLASGFFEGLSAEERLQFDQLINQQNQSQREYLNTNNAYAPRLTFTPKPVTGLIARGRS